MKGASVLLAAVAALCLISFTQAQMEAPFIDYWSTPIPKTVWPPRYDYTAVKDGMDRIFVIAGNTITTGANNDVWMLDTDRLNWSCQSCKTSLPRFAPRYFAGTANVGLDRLIITSGTNATNYFNDVWSSSDLGVSWTMLTAQAPWPAQSNVVLLSDIQESLYAITNIGSATPLQLWFSTAASSYQQWTTMGPINIGNRRSGFGAVITSDQQLYIMGGSKEPNFQQANDVWVADLQSPVPLAWTQLTAAAAWTPRNPSVTVDASGNLWVFGQFNNPGAPPDLLWMSPMTTGGGSVRGTTWIRADNTSCATVFQFPIIPDPGDFTTLLTASNQLFIVSAGSGYRANPTGNDSTAIIQLFATPTTDLTNSGAGLTAWFQPSCPPFTPVVPPSGPSGGGLSGGAKAAIVIVVLLVVAAGVGGFFYLRKRRSFSSIGDNGTEINNFSSLRE